MKNKRLVAIFCGIFACLIVGYLLTRPEEVRIDEGKFYKVARVVDGDTFVADIEGEEITVRMLGINTPETVDPRKPPECYGKEASNEAKTLLNNRAVRFMTNPNRELKDRYGRYLLYVYLGNGLFVNEDLIRNGFAREYTYGKPYRFQAEFKTIESDSMKNGKGLWSACKSLSVQK